MAWSAVSRREAVIKLWFSLCWLSHTLSVAVIVSAHLTIVFSFFL